MQVHNKTVQLQKTNQMNTQINQAYEGLSARCRHMEKMLDNALLHSSQVDGAVRQLCGAMLNGMGGEIDHSQLQQFLKTVMPLLSSTNVCAQHLKCTCNDALLTAQQRSLREDCTCATVANMPAHIF